MVLSIFKEEIVESSKDKEDGRVEVGKVKFIKIKFFGKIVVVYISLWMFVVIILI